MSGEKTRLAAFILANREPILAEWETFARGLGSVSVSMDIAALRDHADEMLTVIAKDLCTPQDKSEQKEKSEGNAPADASSENTAAEEHGAERAESGFSIEEMVSEYRALRASVLRLWTKAEGEIGPDDIEDLTRFNEAIDQSLAESVTRYTKDLDYSKEMFLAILGHDLRSPLSAVMTAANFMLETGDLKEPHLTLTTRIGTSSARMLQMIGDLLDFTRSRLGNGIPVVPTPTNMKKVVDDVVGEIKSAHPNRVIVTEAEKDEFGEWDSARVSQVLANLLGNAIEHGSDKSPVSVRLEGDEKQVSIAIHNQGAAISPAKLSGIFHPMKRKAASEASGGPTANLGLGLYIADRIVNGHKGSIVVDSSDAGGTTFTVRLPRHATANA